jgi:hypothetical protein
MRHVPETIPVSPWTRTRPSSSVSDWYFVPAALQGVEELGLPLHRRIRVHESETVGHHRVEHGHVAGERSWPTSLVGVMIRPARSQSTLAFLTWPFPLGSIGLSGQRVLPHMQVAESLMLASVGSMRVDASRSSKRTSRGR